MSFLDLASRSALNQEAQIALLEDYEVGRQADDSEEHEKGEGHFDHNQKI